MEYGLFKKVGGRYEQVSPYTYPRKTAVRVFQNQLLNSYFSGQPLSLRPVQSKGEGKPRPKPKPRILAMCRPCEDHLHTKHIRESDCECNCRMFNG